MTNHKRFVVYVGPYSFPRGGAAAKRIYGNCVTLSQLGYKVKVVSGQLAEEEGIESNYKGIPVISLNERLYENLPRLLKHLLYFSAGKKAVEWLDSLDTKPDAIILYSGYSPYLIRLIPWARKNKVKLIFDTVEWYDPPNIFSKLFSPYYLNIEFAMRYLLKKCDGLIVISSYLNRYYKDKIRDVVVVPPTVDCSQVEPRVNARQDEVVRFVYAGTPSNKDSLSSIISAVLEVAAAGGRVELNIAGIPKERIFEYMPEGSFQDVGSIVKCHGVISQEDAVDLVRSSDFSIILRPNARNVQAGFPTKFVESLSVGTPVIANLMSDLDLYLEDGRNGYVCKDDTVESLVRVIKKSIENNNFFQMRACARETAERCFDVRVYTDHLKRVVES